jgi:hypothetical protein
LEVFPVQLNVFVVSSRGNLLIVGAKLNYY